MLKLVLIVLFASVFILFFCNKAIKLFNNLLLKRNYRFTETFLYFLAGFTILLISVLLGRAIIYNIM